MKINEKLEIYYYKLQIYKILLFLIFTVMSFAIKKKAIKICLCVIGKNENSYVFEFINHYKKLGYNHIFIYDNNDINGERFSNILIKEIKIGFVTVIDYIGYKGKKNNTQYEAYFDCYKKNKRHYDWLSFFDFDEFLELNKKNETIQKFFDNKLYKNCQIMKINWLIQNSPKELLYYEEKPLKIRFNISIYNNPANKHIKSIVRGNLKGNYWSKWETPHSSSNNFISCSSSGKIVDNKSPFVYPPDYKYASLHHFGKKSFEEYCFKLKRGWPDKTDNKKYINDLIRMNYNNKDKIKIIKRVFNLTKNYYPDKSTMK